MYDYSLSQPISDPGLPKRSSSIGNTGIFFFNTLNLTPVDFKWLLNV